RGLPRRPARDRLPPRVADQRAVGAVRPGPRRPERQVAPVRRPAAVAAALRPGRMRAAPALNTNDEVHLPGRLVRHWTLERPNAAAVRCSGWILMKALVCKDGGGTQPPPVAPPRPGGLHALFPATRRHPILRRRRSPRQVPLPGRPG